MSCRNRSDILATRGRRWLAQLLAFCLLSSPAGSQPFDAQQLASYRLTLPVFTRFAHATRLLAVQMRNDPRFEREPLFSRDVAVAGDAVEMATALRTRLDHDATLASALFAADISAHEYATFAMALVGARLAYGFLESGAMRKVPAGVAADNVAFVRTHFAAIRTTLTQLGLE